MGNIGFEILVILHVFYLSLSFFRQNHLQIRAASSLDVQSHRPQKFLRGHFTGT
jgi:hypothetical protein